MKTKNKGGLTMKIFRILCALCLLLLITASCTGATDVNFAWDYTQGVTPATGFEMRLASVTGGAAVVTKDCGMMTVYVCLVPQVAAGTWFATLYAYASDAVAGRVYADASNELAFTLAGKPNKALNLRIPK
jgi:hypothetical protein